MKPPNFYIFFLSRSPIASALAQGPAAFTGTTAMGSDLLSLPPLSLTPSLFLFSPLFLLPFHFSFIIQGKNS